MDLGIWLCYQPWARDFTTPQTPFPSTMVFSLASCRTSQSALRPNAEIFTPSSQILSQTQETATKVALACLEIDEQIADLTSQVFDFASQTRCRSPRRPIPPTSARVLSFPARDFYSEVATPKRRPLQLAKRSEQTRPTTPPADDSVTIEALHAAHMSVRCILPNARGYFHIMLQEGHLTADEIYSTRQILDKTAAFTAVGHLLVEQIASLSTREFSDSIALCQTLVHRLQSDEKISRRIDDRASISAQVKVVCRVIGVLRREAAARFPRALRSLINQLASEEISPSQLETIEQHAALFRHFATR